MKSERKDFYNLEVETDKSRKNDVIPNKMM